MAYRRPRSPPASAAPTRSTCSSPADSPSHSTETTSSSPHAPAPTSPTPASSSPPIRASSPALRSQYPDLVATFSAAGNARAVALLLDLGFELVDSALPHAVWRGRTAAVKLLIARGAPVEATDASGRTPLSLALRALTDIPEWTPHESTEIVAALLAAGARPDSVHPFPSAAPEADELLRRYGRDA